jgi:hypothetical protein
MQAVGVTATVIAGVVVLGGLYLGIRAVPDMRRYMKIRRM